MYVFHVDSDSDSDEEAAAPALPSAGTLPALAGIPHVLPERLPSAVQPVPLIVTPTPTAEEAKPPTHPVIHVQPQPSEMAYDTSSIQALPSMPPSPTEVDSIKTPSLSDSDDGSVIVSPLTASPSPPPIAMMPSLIGPSQQLFNAVQLPQSHSLVPLVLPPSRQTLAPLNLPGNLPQQPLHVAAQSLDTSMSSEVAQDNSEWGKNMELNVHMFYTLLQHPQDLHLHSQFFPLLVNQIDWSEYITSTRYAYF